MKIVVHEDNTGFAPADCRFYAIDDDTYDGAEDSSNRNHVGYGRTEAEAISDLLRLLDELAETNAP
jgi:hypothetical protein